MPTSTLKKESKDDALMADANPRPAKAPKLANQDDDLDLDDDADEAAMEIEDLDEDEENAGANKAAKDKKKADKEAAKKADKERRFKNGGIDIKGIRDEWYPHLENNILEEGSLLRNADGKVQIKPLETAFYFIMPAKQLKKIFSVFNGLCDRVQFRVHTDNKIRIVGHDKKKESVVEFTKRKFMFFHSQVDDHNIAVQLTDLFKIVNLFGDHDNVIFFQESEEDEVMKIHGYHSYKRNNELSLMSVRLEEDGNIARIGHANLEFESDDKFSSISMTCDELHDVFRDFSALGCKGVKVAYRCNTKELTIGTGGFQETELVSGDSKFTEGDNFKVVNKGKHSNLQMNAESVAKLTAAAKNFSDDGKCTLYMCNQQPFIATYKAAGSEIERKGNGQDTFAFYTFPIVQ